MKQLLIVLMTLLLIPFTSISYANDLIDSYIVVTTNDDAQAALKQLEVIDEFQIGEKSVFVIETDHKTVAALKEKNVIDSYEKNQLVQQTELVQASSTQVVPWGIRQIEADRLLQVPCKCKIAIIDTGIADHPDLNHAIIERATFLSGAETLGQARDDSRDGHGTHIAGIIAAKNNSFGVVGIAEEAQLYIAKALDSKGDGYTSDIAKAIQWAVNRNVDVINLSLGTENSSYLIDQALLYAVNRGVVIVAASGNNGGAVQYPANSPYTIAVSAVDEQRRLTSWTAFGNEVDIVAPGSNIFSTGLRNSYIHTSGTSMAAPHVSGTVAKLLTRYDGPRNSSRTEWVRQQLKQFSDEGFQTNGRLLQQAGFLNLYRSFYQVDYLPSSVTVQLADSQTTLQGIELTRFADSYQRIQVQTNFGTEEFQIR